MIRTLPNWPVMLVLVALAGAAGYATHANRPPSQPSVVATVDLETIFQGLEERGAADTSLTELAGQLDADGQGRREEIDLLSQDLELFPPGSPQFQETAQKLAEKGYELKAYIDFAVRKLDSEKARTLDALYQRIKDTVAAMAQENGYDLVVVDDSIVPLPPTGSEGETMRQISARRLLYVNTTIDITQDVIARMNARFAQGG